MEDSDEMYENRNAVAIGWGTVNVDTGEMPDKLQHVKVKTMSNDECGYYDYDLLSDNMLCAGEEGKDTCYGDSGGRDIFHGSILYISFYSSFLRSTSN